VLRRTKKAGLFRNKGWKTYHYLSGFPLLSVSHKSHP
jgi:hypothetical protein